MCIRDSFQTGHQSSCGIHGGQYIDSSLDGCPADQETIFGMFNTLGWCINNQVDLMSKNQIQQVGRRLFNLIGADSIDACLLYTSLSGTIL